MCRQNQHVGTVVIQRSPQIPVCALVHIVRMYTPLSQLTVSNPPLTVGVPPLQIWLTNLKVRPGIQRRFHRLPVADAGLHPQWFHLQHNYLVCPR